MKSSYTVADRRLLEHLFRIHGRPENGYGNTISYLRKITTVFNSMTTGTKRTLHQIRYFYSYYIQKNAKITKKKKTSVSSEVDQLTISPTTANEIVCKNVRTLTRRGKSSSTASPSGVAKSGFRSLADDLPHSWEFTEIDCIGGVETQKKDSGTLTSSGEVQMIDVAEDVSGQLALVDAAGKNSDLANILVEQAREQHEIKMKVLNEKFRNTSAEYKMKMHILESELAMKRKEHEKKMDILMQKYQKVKQGVKQ